MIDFTLKMVTELDLNAKAGEVYYLRYSEVDKDAAKFVDMTFHDNPLQVVTPDVALVEIQQTNMLDDGRGLIAALPVEQKEETKVAGVKNVAKTSSMLKEEAGGSQTEGNKSWSPF